MIRLRVLPLTLLAFVSPAAAEEIASYARCQERVKEDPEHAFDEALAWRDMGGGAAAEHCAGLALMEQGRYRPAAERFEALANAMSDKTQRADVLDQAGNAWLLDGNADRAYTDFGLALSLAPPQPDILIDRARALLLLGRQTEAERDLSDALVLNPDNVEALTLRAHTRRLRGTLPPARQDAESALRLAPGNPEALVERGLIRADLKDLAGARMDWQLAARSDPNGAAGRTARRLLEQAAIGLPPDPGDGTGR